jgi:hypothetical protein
LKVQTTNHRKYIDIEGTDNNTNIIQTL